MRYKACSEQASCCLLFALVFYPIMLRWDPEIQRWQQANTVRGELLNIGAVDVSWVLASHRLKIRPDNTGPDQRRPKPCDNNEFELTGQRDAGVEGGGGGGEVAYPPTYGGEDPHPTSNSKFHPGTGTVGQFVLSVLEL